MKVINLHGVVGIHIDAKSFADEINATEGDVTLDLNSHGGFIYDGVAIVNAIRSYDRGRVTARVSLAASMMTQIALAADEVQVYDNSVFMIHNALGVAIGDYREMDKRGQMLKAMSKMLSNIYVQKTGKSREDILGMMDAETYLYGSEIVDEGFADTMLGPNGESNMAKEDELVMARAQLDAAIAAIEKENLSADKLAASLKACGGECGLNQPVNGATTFKDFPMVDQPWDSAAAIPRVRRLLGAEDAPNARYKDAFFWYNAEESDLFGAYKLPFVDVVDGRLVAIVNGVNAANGAMSGARGRQVDIPAADRPRVQAHIDRYREKWQREQENNGGEGATALDSVTNSGGKPMTLEKLKAEHPDIFAAAVEIGKKEESDRVIAHVTLGKAAGDMDFAMQCIEKGEVMTNTVIATYTAKGMDRQNQGQRDGDNPGSLNTPDKPEQNAADKELAAAVASALGVEQ